MLPLLLFIGAACVAMVALSRRHFNRRVPPFRLDSVEKNGLQVRRYQKMAVAEVRVSGAPSAALRSGSQLLCKYFRDERIARFALPLLAEKVDAADAIWTMSAILPMELGAAPAPRNKAIQLKELPPHRAIARYLHGPITPDEMIARHKTDMLPQVNDLCSRLGCNKLSTVVTMHRFPLWMPSLFRVSDLLVRVSD